MIRLVFLKQNYLFLAGLFMLAAGLPVSKFLTGFSHLVLLASFFLEGNFQEKLQRLKQNKIVWIISGIWLMHMAGLIHTDDIRAGLWDARMKMSILIVTVVVGSAAPLSPRNVKRLMWAFVFSVLLGSLISTAVLAGFISRPVDDIRDIFIFHISHIRFALFVCLCIFFIAGQLFSDKTKSPLAARLAYFLLLAWFVFFLFLAESVTGLAIFFALSVPALVVLGLTRENRVVKAGVLALAVLFPAVVIVQAVVFWKEINKTHPLEINTSDRTALGNEYHFIPEDKHTENGYLVWVYFNKEELRSAWNDRSVIPYDSLDNKSQPVSQTLIRYLTSLGWRKDAEAVGRLSPQDIHSIESGIANIQYTGTSNFKARLIELNWEYQQALMKQSPAGHSAAMRIEFWKNGWEIFRQNIWTGVGTGDLQQAYDKQYEQAQSQLSKPWRLRAHNQYLSIAIAFGIFGLIYFLFALVYPVIKLKKVRDFTTMSFIGILLLSMLTEDTLETPAGAAFYALFNSLFLFGGGADENSGKSRSDDAPRS